MANIVRPPYDPEKESSRNPIVPARENFRLAFSGEKPYWMPHVSMFGGDMVAFRPRVFPDNLATRGIIDGEPPIEWTSNVGTGYFGLQWVFVNQVGGATVKPGAPLIEDMNDWEEKLVWPDLDELDWEGLGKNNKEYLGGGTFSEIAMLDGCWERLISLMDVSGAAMAMIDEDQHDALIRFFTKYTDLEIEEIRRVKEVCDISCVLIHDDWGHQNSSFFSLATAREMLLPNLKRLIDAIHDMGLYYEQHSCGYCTEMVPAYMEAGVDLWCPQPLNDLDRITKECEGSRLHIGMDIPGVTPATPPEEAVEAARRWFDKYGDRPVFYSGMNAAAAEELYRLSRVAYAR